MYLQVLDYFDASTIQKLFVACGATSILCTSKDKVKMLDFTLPLSEMKLKLKIDNAIIKQIETYREGYKSER